MKSEDKNNLLKKIIIILMIILVSIFCVLMMIQNYIKIRNTRIQNAIITGNFDSIKDILEYYDCKYINDKKSDLEGFSVDIYVNFKCNLYDGEERSNLGDIIITFFDINNDFFQNNSNRLLHFE